jgi:hypothetical protein
MLEVSASASAHGDPDCKENQSQNWIAVSTTAACRRFPVQPLFAKTSMTERGTN